VKDDLLKLIIDVINLFVEVFEMAIKKDGPAIIDTMVGKFQGIVDGLDKGLNLCSTKQEQNSKIISSLTAENGFLEGKTQEAKTFRDNLKDMLGHNSKISPENKKDNE
jgi:hypothetical protein